MPAACPEKSRPARDRTRHSLAQLPPSHLHKVPPMVVHSANEANNQITRQVARERNASRKEKEKSRESTMKFEKSNQMHTLKKLMTSKLIAAILVMLPMALCAPAVDYPQAKLGLSTFNDLAAQTASIYMSNTQASACDGETLNIKCTEDYLIDVITAELTILPSTQLHETSSQTRKTEVSKSLPVSPSLDSNRICRPTLNGRATIKTTITQTTTTNAAPPTEETNEPGDSPPPPTKLATTTVVPETATSAATNLVDSTTNLPSTNGNAALKLCDEQQSRAAVAAADRTELVSLVKTECQLRGSCSLDLRQSRPAPSTTIARPPGEHATPVPGEARRNTSAASLKSSGIRLSQIVTGDEQCSSNRKLLEVVYRCRPSRFSRRTRCRGSWLTLECPPGKRLYVITGQYGANTTDTKTHERCSGEQVQPHKEAGSQVALRASSQPSRVCMANETQRLVEKCMMKQHCSILADHSALGEPNCSSGLTEILSVVFTCTNETLLRNDASTSHLWAESHLVGNTSLFRVPQPLANLTKLARQENRYPLTDTPPMLTSSNITPSIPLLGAAAQDKATTHSLGLYQGGANNQMVMASTSSDRVQQHRTSIEAPSGSSLFAGQTQLEYPSNEQQDFESRTIATPSYAPNDFVTATSGERTTLTLNAFKGLSDQWDQGQRMKLFLNRYRMQIVAISTVFLTIVTLAAVFNGCRRLVSGKSGSCGARRSSSGSLRKDNPSSDSSSNKSSAGLKSLSCSTASSTIAQVNHTKHNSCSESCFSLQEDDFNTATTTTTTNGYLHCSEHSPTGDTHTPLSTTASDQQTLARPKLWTIYSGQQQRSSANQALRPTRTFLTNQQHVAQCLAHHPAPVAPPTCARQAAGAAELLLAMATAASQQQQQEQHRETANCCNSFHQQQQILEFPSNTIQLELPQPTNQSSRQEFTGLPQFDSNLIQTHVNLPPNLYRH